MKNWFLKLRIRLKLLLAFGSILLMSIILIAVGVGSINTIISYNNLAERIDAINISSLEMSRYIQQFAEKGFKKETFLKEDKSDLIDGYKETIRHIEEQLDTLYHHELFSKSQNEKLHKNLAQSLNNYQSHVNQLLAVYKERGFKDYGVEGSLREAIHNVEDTDYPYNKATMLMLRRHEKDFFLRKDLKYLNRFNTAIETFKSELQHTDSTNETVKLQLLKLVDLYKKEFNHIVKLEQQIGLDSQQGILGAMNASYDDIQNSLNDLTQLIKNEKASSVKHALIILLGLLVFQCISGLVMVVLYANLLTKAIKEIKHALVSLSKGEFPSQLAIRTKDEIAETKRALNNLVDRIKSAVQFATDLGKGNLNIKYNSKYDDDVLARAIITMKDQLVAANERQAIINWSNEGMAKFSDILKDETEDLKILGDRIIAQMVTYLGINQGALYILNSDTEELERIATYAYQKKKFVDHTVKVGQGLAGQCVLEQSYIYLKEVPADYINITSGLGEATPNSILLMPLKVRDEVMGVIELASFKDFSDDVIRFIEKVSENIASILSNKKTAESMRKLLEESQEKAEEMRAQEEEMRQNSEELQSTQEEMERQRKELVATIEKLESKLFEKEEALVELRAEREEKRVPQNI